MRTEIIKIENSQDVRISKVLIDESGLSGEVKIRLRHSSIVIEKADHPRSGWDKSFREMAQASDHALLDSDTVESSFDAEEWEW